MKIYFRFRHFMLFLLLGITIFISCGKKWKKPTDVYFEFQLNNNSNDGLVKFIDGSINLNKIIYSGERSQGLKNIGDEQNISNNQLVRFDYSMSNSGIKFNIPQGTYSKMNINLETNSDQGAPSIIMNGRYINSINNDTNLVQLQLFDNQILNFNAKNSNGSSEINLIEGYSSTIAMVLNPKYWFGQITAPMLDTSDVNISNNDHIIFINKNENSDLYNLIINRINENNEAILK